MRRWLVALLLVSGAVWYFAFRGSDKGPSEAPPAPNPAGAFSIAVLGDAPYFAWEEPKYRRVLRQIDAHDLSFVVHVGDIFWKPCDVARYEQTRQEFNRLRHPVIYTPGDNEWADCWESGAGGFAPLDRLQRLREVFFREPEHSLGGRRIPLASQRAEPGFSDFVENARWTHDRIFFATVHIVGSSNGTDAFPSRTEADSQQARRRTDAAAAWIRRTFSEAMETKAAAVVIALHANPFFERPSAARRKPFEPFLTALEEEAVRFAGPVLVAHGDHHVYLVDRPITRSTGERVDNVTRLQVPGSPLIGWVRVAITAGAKDPFTFEVHTIPAWQYW